ncbi:MAG: hypothetical protein ACK47B_24585 [Armatimonadota bacterium]
MQLDLSRIRLAHLPLAARVVISGFVVVALTGYLIALLNMYLTYANADGKPGLTPADLEKKLRGDRTNTKLEAALNGTMGQYLKTPEEKQQIVGWIHAGAMEADFARVQPVLQKNCVSCHSSSGAASFRPLTSFREVSVVAQVDTGESLATFARVAHTHLQSLALIYFGLGILFAFCGLPEKLKAVFVATPFLALVLDFGARGLARFWPEMIYPMMAGGGIAGMATTLMAAGILWEVWFAGRQKHKPMPEPLPEPVPASG